MASLVKSKKGGVSFTSKARGKEQSVNYFALTVVRGIVNNAITQSEDVPLVAVNITLQDLQCAVLSAVDPFTICEDVLHDIVETIVAKLKFVEKIVNEIFEKATAVGNIMTIKEEMRLRLDDIVNSIFEEKPTQFIAGIVNEIVNNILRKKVAAIKEEPRTESKDEKDNKVCVEFSGYNAITKNLVEEILEQSKEQVKNLEDIEEKEVKESKVKHSAEEEEDKDDDDSQSLMIEIITHKGDSDWPSIAEFTVRNGQEKIAKYLESWEFSEDWLYCIDYLELKTDEINDYYDYEAIWSIPTPAYPVPQATASIYFTLGVSRVLPKECKIDVKYFFEGSRFVHSPGVVPISEDWLFYIIDAKIKFIQNLEY